MIKLDGRFLYSVACRSFANMHQGQREETKRKRKKT